MNLNRTKNLLLTLSSLLLFTLFSEFALRFFYEPIKSGWGWQDSPRRSLSTLENDSTNGLGLRGQKITYSDDDFIVLLVGDSQVEAATSVPLNMPERLLQNFLNRKLTKNIKVFSIAASGWGQDQQLCALEEYYKYYRADLVIIWATPKNDFWENTFPDRSLTKTAGHIKPTYQLNGNNILGPFFQPNTYYKNSVILQLFYSALQTIKEETLEQHILAEWMDSLPAPHNHMDYPLSVLRNNSKEIELKEFSENLSAYSNRDSLTIIINEDFLNSRSHFSPYAKKLSPRDNYLINITQKLFEAINNLTKSHDCKMFVFYPIREDYDQIYNRTVKYVKLKSIPEVLIPVKLDYLSALKKVIPQDLLISFNVSGGEELSVSVEDRHFSEIGNEIIMEKLADFILDYTKK